MALSDDRRALEEEYAALSAEYDRLSAKMADVYWGGEEEAPEEYADLELRRFAVHGMLHYLADRLGI